MLSPGLELALDDFEAFFRVDNVEGASGSSEFTFVGAVAAEFEEGCVGVGDNIGTAKAG